MNTEEEWFPVVDKDGNEILQAPRSRCHDGISRLLHPVVHLHLFNDKGELFLQKRAMTKDLLPGKWDTSVGGHIRPGEKTEDALRRETEEELGIISPEFQFIKKYIWESPLERELVYSFRGCSSEEPAINRDEIDEGRFWSAEEILTHTGKGIFTPNFEYEFKMLLSESGKDK